MQKAGEDLPQLGSAGWKAPPRSGPACPPSNTRVLLPCIAMGVCRGNTLVLGMQGSPSSHSALLLLAHPVGCLRPAGTRKAEDEVSKGRAKQEAVRVRGGPQCRLGKRREQGWEVGALE